MASAAADDLNDEIKKGAADMGASRANLENDVRQLREDVAELARQIARTGERGYGTARRAATEGVEQLRTQGEAAMDQLRSSAEEFEAQVVDSVREKPITSLAIAAGVGYLFALMSRR